MGPFANIFEYLGVYREYIGRRLYIVFALTVLTALAEGFGITLLLPLLKATESGGSQEAIDGGLQEVLFDLLHWMGIGDSIVGILAFIGVVFVAKGLLKFADGAYKGYLQSRLLRELKEGLFDAYSTMNYCRYIDNNTGHFINVINGQVGDFYGSFSSFIRFLSTLITTASYFAIAFAITWRFALMAVGVGILLLFLFRTLSRYVRRLSRRVSQEMSHMNKLLVQALQAFKYIVSTAQVDHLRKGITASIRRLTTDRFWQAVAGSFTGAIKEPVSVLFIISVIIVQVTVFNESVTPIFVAILLFHRGMNAIVSIQSSWQETMTRIGALEMVSDEFDAVRRNQEINGTEPVEALETAIEFEDVCFAYDPEEGDVLKSVNLTIPANTTVAFVGESGAGKSTLIDMLTLLLQPRSGSVRIDGIHGTKAELRSWRSQIGYVSQETVIFDDTIANNISLWKGDEDDPETQAAIKEAARRAYAHHFIESLPNGYQTPTGDQGVRLSGGQRQRLFIARELFKNPNLLILDEATSALDTESERYIQNSIDDLKGEMTVVIIAHRLSTIKNVDRVYVMDDGRVVEDGTYEELRQHQDSRFREMVDMQML